MEKDNHPTKESLPNLSMSNGTVSGSVVLTHVPAFVWGDAFLAFLFPQETHMGPWE